MRNALIIFIKNAKYGKVKTRLAKDIGNTAALEAYNELLTYTQQITAEVNAVKLLFYNQAIYDNDNWSNETYQKFLQEKGDLGEKMEAAFHLAIKHGQCNKIVIIGSDNPFIKPSQIEEAYKFLDHYDIVIGPALDGGYYLLGMKTMQTYLFRNKPWSSDTLLIETIKEIESKKMSYHLLEPLRDIDTYEDWKHWKQETE